MSIVFNSKDHVKERQESEPLSLEEMIIVVSYLDECIRVYNYEFSTRHNNLENSNLVQRLLFDFENLKHASQVKCQCCYKNTTADIDVNYEIVNNKTDERN